MATTAQPSLGGVATGTPVQRFVYPPFNPAALSYTNSVSGPLDQVILADPMKWYDIGRKLGVGNEGYKGVVAYHHWVSSCFRIQIGQRIATILVHLLYKAGS
jgi:hypothetical protein